MSSFATNAVCADEVLCSRELLEETVSVINTALHEEAESSSDSDGPALGERISNGRTLRVLVFDPQDMVEGGAVDIRFGQEKVTLVKEENAGRADASVKVCGEHLRNVCSNPEVYVDDPMKIELVWMKDRMTA